MKSERRHDLETNQLAVQVQDWLDRVKPYASQIAMVVLGIAVLAFIASEWGNASSSTDQAAWDEFTLASYSSDPDWNSMKLLADNEEFEGTPVPEWAYLAWSDRQVLRASQSYLMDRASTMTRLKQVQPIYENLAEGASNPQVQDRAHFGLAQVLEMQGKVDDARAAYARVKGDLSAIATARAEQLESANVKEACDWLATAELPKRELPSTTGAATGLRPNFEADVPATVPNDTPITDTRTLEEILTGETGGLTGDNRYGEAEDEAAPTSDLEATTEEAAPADEAADPAADEKSESEKPATDAAGQ